MIYVRESWLDHCLNESGVLFEYSDFCLKNMQAVCLRIASCPLTMGQKILVPIPLTQLTVQAFCCPKYSY